MPLVRQSTRPSGIVSFTAAECNTYCAYQSALHPPTPWCLRTCLARWSMMAVNSFLRATLGRRRTAGLAG
jgi:hypothetical protein